MKIEIISGSARPERKSHQVALALQQMLDKNHGIAAGVLDVKEFNLPLLEYVYSKHPSPSDAMKNFSARLVAATAFIVVSPEHNASYSGALKNTMDYFYPEYEGKAFGIVTVSNGMLGGINAMKNLQLYCLKLNGIVSPAGLITPKVQDLFENGTIKDAGYEGRMAKFIEGFLSFAARI